MKNKHKNRMKRSTGDWIADIVIMLLLLAVAFISFIPLWHVVMSSFSDGQLLMSHKGVAWLPEKATQTLPSERRPSCNF